MKKEKTVRWFVYPLNKFTNNLIAEEMAKLGEQMIDLINYQGKTYQVWPVKHLFIQRLKDSRCQEGSIRFRVFVKEGDIVKEWFRGIRPVFRRSKKIKKIQKQLKN